ncbi:MAG: MerR family transcriptional regulator [Lachnospiraceae bacterium]|jgi:DNA-binding transcriptional MerR regulator|nr:MerR family transcriptional regulator [Lachnospiraceae bacterium]
MYTMKQTCEKTGMHYETLKFYCNQGLIPNVKRDKANRRIFDEQDIEWIHSLSCLKKCGMTHREMKEYLALCGQGRETIPERLHMLEKRRNSLLASMAELQSSIDFIDRKQSLYTRLLAEEPLT